MSRCLCPSHGLLLESWDQQICNPFVHLLGEDWSCMHWQPDILPIAPNMVGQTYGHCWGAWRAPLAQALMRHHKVVKAHHEPDLPPVARAAPGQTPSAAPQGRDQPTQGAIPAFHERCLDRLSELPEAQLLAKTAWATEDHAPAHLHDMARLVADLHDLSIEQVFGGHEPWFGLAAHFPTTSRTIHDPHDL